jgi:hypothetical protein
MFSETGKKVFEEIHDFLVDLKQEILENPDSWTDWDIQDIAMDLTAKIDVCLKKETLIVYKDD